MAETVSPDMSSDLRDSNHVASQTQKVIGTENTEIPRVGFRWYDLDRYGVRLQYPSRWRYKETGSDKDFTEVDFSNLFSVRVVDYKTDKTIGPDSAFKTPYERHAYFHGEPLEVIDIDGFSLLVSPQGCYECYDFSKEEIDRTRDQLNAIVCNEHSICMEIWVSDVAPWQWPDNYDEQSKTRTYVGTDIHVGSEQGSGIDTLLFMKKVVMPGLRFSKTFREMDRLPDHLGSVG